MTQPAECAQCSVPTSGGPLCDFCQGYTPPVTPAVRLDQLVNRVDLLRADLDAVLAALPRATTPVDAVQNVTSARTHLRMAAVALDAAADRIERV